SDGAPLASVAGCPQVESPTSAPSPRSPPNNSTPYLRRRTGGPPQRCAGVDRGSRRRSRARSGLGRSRGATVLQEPDDRPVAVQSGRRVFEEPVYLLSRQNLR